MAGLYDLNLDAQILDDQALAWDDPDFDFSTVAPGGVAASSGIGYDAPVAVSVTAGLASASGAVGNAGSALGTNATSSGSTGTALLPTPLSLEGGNLASTGSLVMHL